MAVQKRPAYDKPKRQRKRKARTEVSSDESDSDSSVVSVESPVTKSDAIKDKPKELKRVAKNKPEVLDDHHEIAALARQREAEAKAEDAFTSFYLRQTTSEFAEDLDKIRAAGDFNEKGLTMLIDALKQGRECFEKDERLAVGRVLVAHDT